MKRKLMARQRRNVMIAACGLLLGAWTMQGCKDDTLLEGQPSWLGNSIYERLQEEGTYTTLLRLVDDLGQHEVLSHTGSKTLFAANDSAFQEWYKQNPWGVKSYGQLSDAQKKLLLNNSMINNAYLIELLSNVSGNPPMEGKCMRRETAVSIYDSVEYLSPAKMPNTPVWRKFKDRGKSIPIFKDATAAPMIHFLPAFATYNKLTNEDLSILTNHQATDIKEAWVNGKKVVDRDITCKNGYIQKVSGVIESSPNMAEIIRQHPDMSLWSHLMDRFSAPYYSPEGTKEYNRLYNNEDSVYVLRYYSKLSVDGDPNERDPNGEAVKALLKFDPGWNHYMYTNTMNYDLHYDAGVMIVPTNEALQYWWEHGEGTPLRTEYGEWDSIPDATLAKLINVNMLPTFTEAFPSKFKQVLNDAKDELGIVPADVDSCFMGCNGVVYMTNKLFTPAEYASVAYPALAHESKMNVIYWAIDQLNFLPYLLSMDSKYSMLLPTNGAMMWYIDPYSYGTVDPQSGLEMPDLLQFYYDAARGSGERVQARRYSCKIDEAGNITDVMLKSRTVNLDVVKDRLRSLMDQLIIVGEVQDDGGNVTHEYFKTKGGTLLRAYKGNDGRVVYEGGWQNEHGNFALPVNNDEIYNMKNGRSYTLNGEKYQDGDAGPFVSTIPLGAQNSVYMTLQKHEEFTEFLNLLDHDGADLLSTKLSNKYEAGLAKLGNKNLRLLDHYNYTVYVPTNESIRQLIDDGILPTWEDYEMIGDNDKSSEYYNKYKEFCKEMGWSDAIAYDEVFVDSMRGIVKNIIVDFLRYHIQDHSVAVNMAPDNGSYVNAYESMKRNPETGRFFPIEVDFSGDQIKLRDNAGNTRHVKTDNKKLYNQICREYWYDTSKKAQDIVLTFMASDAVVHQIDGVLLFDSEMKPWKQQLKQANVRRK